MAEFDIEKIGLRVKKLREAKGLSLNDLSVLANVSKEYIWKLENNKIQNIGLELLASIATALKAPFSFIVVGEIYAENTLMHTELQNALMPGNELLPLTPEEREILLDIRGVESKKQRASIKDIVKSWSSRGK